LGEQKEEVYNTGENCVNNGLLNSPSSGSFLRSLQDALVAFPQATSSVATVRLPHEGRIPRHV